MVSPLSFHHQEYTSYTGCLILRPTTGARVLYRLQPDLRDKAVGYVTDLSDKLKGRTLEVGVAHSSSL